jgi:TonB family protein
MIDAKVEGVIKAILTVDVDGKVKDVKILNDLGYGTKKSALEAVLKWVFEPARRGAESVATIITYSIRFVFLEG